MNKIKLEIACFSLEAAIRANQFDIDRIEFCENYLEGGITPSYGQIKLARQNVQKDLYIMIRPRGGDFVYNENEFQSMLLDIEICKQLHCDGIVIGFLNIDGTIDIQKLQEAVTRAKPMGVTFHRAFDRAIHPHKALEKIIESGCERILTSGQKPSAMEGIQLIKELVQLAKNEIKIMAGAGITSANSKQMIEETGVTELHSSAKKQIPSKMEYINTNFIEKNVYQLIDEDEIKKMALIVNC